MLNHLNQLIKRFNKSKMNNSYSNDRNGLNFSNKFKSNHLSFLTTFPDGSLWTLVGGTLILLSSVDLTLTILEWIAHPTQYCILMYNLGMT